jgi:asparagine synthase (glutamine-hydrolysing)
MPPRLKLNGLNEKYVLKQCMTSRLPEVPHAYKKRGFYTPISAWFFTPRRMEALQPYLSRAALLKVDLFDPGRVETLQRQLQGMAKPTDMNAHYRCMQLEWTLFTVLTTQILHQQFVEKAAPQVTQPQVSMVQAACT